MFSIRYLMYQCVPDIRKSLHLLILLTSCNLTTCYKHFSMPVFAVAVITNKNYQTFQPSGIYLLKVVEIRSKVWNMFKLTITTPARCQLSSLQCFYCKLYTHFTTCLVFVLLILNNQLFLGSCFLLARRDKDKQPCEILPQSSCSADSKKAV